MSKVVTQLNQIQIDAHALFVKLHNYHWNVKGLQFFAIHSFTEGLYNEMAELFDDVAERALQLNGKAVTCLKTLAEKTQIKPDSKDSFEAKDVLKGIAADFELLRKSFVKLSEVAEKEGDKTTANLADDNVAKLEKHLWMINASLA